MDPFRIRPWRLFFGVVGTVFVVSLFLALATYDDDNVPAFAGQEALFWTVCISLAALALGAAVFLAIGISRRVRRSRRARLAVVVVVALVAAAGVVIGSVRHSEQHRELAASDQQRLGQSWERLRSVCQATRPFSASDAQTATADLNQIIEQFRVSPDAKTRFGNASELRSMRTMVKSLVTDVGGNTTRCVAVTGTAQQALEREADGEVIAPPPGAALTDVNDERTDTSSPSLGVRPSESPCRRAHRVDDAAGDARRWVLPLPTRADRSADLRTVAVSVSRDELCVTFTTAAPLTEDSELSFIARGPTDPDGSQGARVPPSGFTARYRVGYLRMTPLGPRETTPQLLGRWGQHGNSVSVRMPLGELARGSTGAGHAPFPPTAFTFQARLIARTPDGARLIDLVPDQAARIGIVGGNLCPDPCRLPSQPGP